MTKEALDRIKEAYYSGLKVQIWFDGHWENFDAREYSMYPDPFSENRQYRIVGSAYVNIAEKQIADLEQENAELKEKLNRYKHDCHSCTAFGKHCPHKVKGDPYFYDCYLTVIELEQENATLKKQLEALSGDIPWNKLKDVSEVTKKLTEAKEIIKEYMRFEPMIGTCSFYSEEYEKTKKKAEQFLNNEVEK